MKLQGDYIIDNPYYHLGTTLKTVRINKGYTQQEVSENVMSRSNYTKVEQDEVIPNTVKFISILDRIDMSQAEFSFILNGNKLTSKDNILYLFKNMGQSPALSYIQNLITLATESLNEREDHLIRDILHLTLGYWALLKEHNLVNAQNHAQKVWKRMKELDKFFLTEFHLLNRILYFFDLETAVSMTDIALDKLESYFCFKEAEDLRLSYMSNIACILIDNNEHGRAMVYVEKLITESKKAYNVLVLAGALVRKAMCQSAFGEDDASQVSFQSASSMFKILERDDFVQGILTLPKAVYNPFGYVNLLAS